MIGTQHNKISQPDLFKSCRRFTPCAKENQMEAIIAARPINKPNTDPPADPVYDEISSFDYSAGYVAEGVKNRTVFPL